MSRKPIDFKALAADALASIERVLDALLPDGHCSGVEWVGPNPVSGQGSKRFSVNTRTGVWKDFADDQTGGGDLISLWAYARQTKDQATAARELQDFLGLLPADPAPKREKKVETSASPVLVIVPENAPPIKDRLHDRGGKHKDGKPRPAWGDPTHVWAWRDRQGNLRHYTARYWGPDHEGGGSQKQNRPISLVNGDRGMYWSWKWPPKDPPRTLLGAHLLDARPAAPAVIVEGEKAWQALHDARSDLVPLTTFGGANNAASFNWADIQGRTIVFWPDYDEPGAKYVAKIIEQLLTIIPSFDYFVVKPELLATAIQQEVMQKDDAADLTKEQLQALVFKNIVNQQHAGEQPAAANVPPLKPPVNHGASHDDYDSSSPHQRTIAELAAHLQKNKIVIDATGSLRKGSYDSKGTKKLKSIVNSYLFHQRNYVHKPSSLTAQYITETLGVMVEDAADERFRSIIDCLTGRPATEAGHKELDRWLMAVTGKIDQADREVMRHWMWLIKRRACGLPVGNHIMPVVRGPQGSGKTTAVNRLARVWQELTFDARSEHLTDARNAMVLERSLIGVWDEMHGQSRQDIDALKNKVSSDEMIFRVLGGHEQVRVAVLTLWIGTSNKPVAVMITDTTGARRFYEIVTPSRCDWDLMDSLNYPLVWQSVSEHDAQPILSVIATVRERQRVLVHKDTIAQWIEGEDWQEIHLQCQGAVVPVVPLPGQEGNRYGRDWDPAIATLPAYDPAIGFSFEELAMRYRHWCQLIGQPAQDRKAFAPRLHELGVVVKQVRKFDRQRRYYLPPEMYVPATPHPQSSGESKSQSQPGIMKNDDYEPSY